MFTWTKLFGNADAWVNKFRNILTSSIALVSVFYLRESGCGRVSWHTFYTETFVRIGNEYRVVTGYPLLDAARMGDVAEVKRLIQAGSDVRARDPRRYTALHWAAKAGNPAILKMLLDAGADINAKAGVLETALIDAADVPASVEFLITALRAACRK